MSTAKNIREFTTEENPTDSHILIVDDNTSETEGTKILSIGKLKEYINSDIPTSWTDVEEKPFTTISPTDFAINDNGELSVQAISGKTLGITIPTVETPTGLFLKDDGTWSPAQGEKGDTGEDGFSPIATVEPNDNGATVSITDINGTTSTEISNGNDGLTPHIDESTKHWFIGEEDTGVLAEAVSTVITNAVVYNGTLNVDNWVGDTAPYTQEVTINGISVDSRPYLYISYSTDNTDTIIEEQKQWGYITRAVTSDNIITFYCYKNKPTITLNFEAEVR